MTGKAADIELIHIHFTSPPSHLPNTLLLMSFGVHRTSGREANTELIMSISLLSKNPPHLPAAFESRMSGRKATKQSCLGAELPPSPRHSFSQTAGLVSSCTSGGGAMRDHLRARATLNAITNNISEIGKHASREPINGRAFGCAYAGISILALLLSMLIQLISSSHLACMRKQRR